MIWTAHDVIDRGIQPQMCDWLQALGVDPNITHTVEDVIADCQALKVSYWLLDEEGRIHLVDGSDEVASADRLVPLYEPLPSWWHLGGAA